MEPATRNPNRPRESESLTGRGIQASGFVSMSQTRIITTSPGRMPVSRYNWIIAATYGET